MYVRFGASPLWFPLYCFFLKTVERFPIILSKCLRAIRVETGIPAAVKKKPRHHSTVQAQQLPALYETIPRTKQCSWSHRSTKAAAFEARRVHGTVCIRTQTTVHSSGVQPIVERADLNVWTCPVVKTYQVMRTPEASHKRTGRLVIGQPGARSALYGPWSRYAKRQRTFRFDASKWGHHKSRVSAILLSLISSGAFDRFRSSTMLAMVGPKSNAGLFV